jgi:hypothetical protein
MPGQNRAKAGIFDIMKMALNAYPKREGKNRGGNEQED